MNFEFATAARIIFGRGTLRNVGAIAAELGRRALLVTGSDAARSTPLVGMLSAAGMETHLFNVAGEPTVELVWQGVEQARQFRCDVVIGCGGGSAIDAGKAIAVLLTNRGDVMDYVEIIGGGQALAQPPLSYIAIPTTAGTGAEVTRNAVLGSPQHGVKVSLRSVMMLPRVALVDPELTYSMPPHVTASTGMDALTQLLESFVSIGANPLADLFCRDGLMRAARSLRRAYEGSSRASTLHADDIIAAREDMALAGLYGGLALANSRLGAVHGFAAPIGGVSAAPHGAICARMLPFVMEANIRALQTRMPESAALGRYQEVAQILTGGAAASAHDGVSWVEALCRDLNIPALSTFGIAHDAISSLVEKSAPSRSMQGNPVELTAEEMQEILMRAC
jgi:alcohol dehydrogenase class IV